MKNKDLETKLLKFLDMKPADETYDYCLSGHCAAAQFNKAIDRTYPIVRALADREYGNYFDGQLEKAASEYPRTFGDLLKRVRKLEDA